MHNIKLLIAEEHGSEQLLLSDYFSKKQEFKIIGGYEDENTILNTYKNGIPFYYPSVIFKSDYATAEEKEEALALGRQKKLTGTLQYRNDTSLSFEYFFNDKLKVATEGTYSFIINNKNVQGDFKQGFELKLAVSYNLF